MDEELRKQLYTANWTKRRQLLLAVVFWAMGSVSYIIWNGSDTELNRTALVLLVGAIVSLVGSWVFGSIWDDKNKRDALPVETVISEPTPTPEVPQ